MMQHALFSEILRLAKETSLKKVALHDYICTKLQNHKSFGKNIQEHRGKGYSTAEFMCIFNDGLLKCVDFLYVSYYNKEYSGIKIHFLQNLHKLSLQS